MTGKWWATRGGRQREKAEKENMLEMAPTTTCRCALGSRQTKYERWYKLRDANASLFNCAVSISLEHSCSSSTFPEHTISRMRYFSLFLIQFYSLAIGSVRAARRVCILFCIGGLARSLFWRWICFAYIFLHRKLHLRCRWAHNNSQID